MKRKSKFIVYLSSDGWRWRLVSANGRIVCQGEAYTDRRGAERGLAAVRRAAAAA